MAGLTLQRRIATQLQGHHIWLVQPANIVKLSSPRSVSSSSRSPHHLESTLRAQRSLSPSGLVISPTGRKSSYSSGLLSVPGSVPGEAGGLFGQSPTAASSDTSRHRRGSRSSILASASSFEATNFTSDKESIRSAGSSSRAGPSTPRQKSRRGSRNDDAEYNASPVSFYSPLEAPLNSPRRSRQGSMQVESARSSLAPRSPSPHDAQAERPTSPGRLKPKGLPTSQHAKTRSPQSPDAVRAATERMPLGKFEQPNLPALRAAASAQHDRLSDASDSVTLMPSLSAYVWGSRSQSHDHSSSPYRSANKSRLELDGSSAPSSNSQPRSFSSSRSVNTFGALDDNAVSRPRSKSNTSPSKPTKSQPPIGSQPLSTRMVGPSEMPPPPVQPTKTLPSAPSKPSLRSRIFGLKGSNAASPSTSSVDSGAETPSPRSAQFAPSIHSEGSHSDSHSIDPAMLSPSYPQSSDRHSRHNDEEVDEDSNADRANVAANRKSQVASSFLRKTIRFKDKSGFLKARPSVSSMVSDSATSASASVPPSPLDQPHESDAEDVVKKSPVYKQISGRRGPRYNEPAGNEDKLTSANLYDPPQHELESFGVEPDAIVLLPPVTECDLEAPAKPQRSLPGIALRTGSNEASSFVAASVRTNKSGMFTPERLTTSSMEREAQSYIPRSSSLYGSIGRGKPEKVRLSQTFVDRAASSALPPADLPESPRRRPRSGSATTFTPQIQPRTTSSPSQSSMRRPLTAQGSPSAVMSPYATTSSSSRPVQRAHRPKTADSGHAHFGSLSSLRDILMVAHAISEEGAVFNTPDKKDVARFEGSSSLTVTAKMASSTGDSRRPGLPPKNPLRKQGPSVASVIHTPSIAGDSPGSPYTTGVFPGPSMSESPDEHLLSPGPLKRVSIGPMSASSSTSSLTEFKTPTSHPAPLPSMDSQAADDYFRVRDPVRPDDATVAQIPSHSHGLMDSTYSGFSSPARSSFASAQHLSQAPSSDSTAGWVPRRHERAASDATNSLTDVRSPSGPSASTPSLHSESSSATRKKKEGAGSKMFAFARDLANRDGSEAGAGIPSSGTFRLGRSSKSKVSTRPVIRRLYDGPLEGEAAALASGHGGGALHSPSQFTNGISPGTSVTDLTAAGTTVPPTSSGSGTPAMRGRNPSSGNLIRSASSSGSTARDLMSPPSTHLQTPQFSKSNGPFLTRSPSFARPAWSIPQDDLSQEQKRLVKRWFVLRELLDTERAYASDLAVARDIYMARAKIRAGITAPLSPLSVRSASIFSQLASPEPSTYGRSSQPHLQQRGSTSTLSPGPGIPSSRIPLPQRTLFRNASADGTASTASASPASAKQTASSASLTSSNTSNRSSMYTVSSQSSQTSDASHFALAGHPSFYSGLPSQFSIDGSTLSPTASVKMTPGTPMTLPSPGGVSPYSSTPSINTPCGPLSPGAYISNETGPTSTADAPFSASEVRIVFAQLESCAAFADEMVVILESAVGRLCTGTAEDAAQMLARGEVSEELETDRVGQAFLKLMPRIERVYSAYCSKHEASMAKLQELMTTQPKAAAFLAECTRAARAYTNAWDLSSLLIKPVQRVLKYPLLLSEILGSTTNKHPDMESLSAASVEIQKVADNINEVKKRKDLVEQIVSGKTTKRTTSQRMQHGATKKLLRRQEKVKKLVLGPNGDLLADEGQYKALVVQFRQLEKAVTAFARRCTSWSTNVKDAHIAQLKLLDQWCRFYALDQNTTGTEMEIRPRAFMHLIERTFLSDCWTTLDSEIRTSLTPAIQRIASLFILPQSVISKRNERESDYSRYRTIGPRSADKKLGESATAFIALHTQLMNELPQFNYGIQTLLDLCIESLSRTQASYHLRVHRALVRFWQSFGGEADMVQNEETVEKSIRHSNPVKIFWPLHRDVADYAESLGIVNGAEGCSRSGSISMDRDLLAVGNLNPSSNTHFSPLQSARALPGSEFASNVPDASGLVSQQIENLTAAGSEELLDLVSARASPFTTPPLGSRRPSFSPQLHQQHLLGSPAPIGSLPLSGTTHPPLRSSKSGGLFGLLRSVGSSSAVGSRKNSQSTDTAAASFVDGLDSNPPTPVSKDTPLRHEELVAAPTLPALSFNNGFFGQSGAVFSSASEAHGTGFEDENSRCVETSTLAANQDSGNAVVEYSASSRRGSGSDRGEDRTIRMIRESSAGTPLGTMAAVANSRTTSRGTKNGYPFVEYAVGDLFRVRDHDEMHLFGDSEHGITGWVERENFVPLS
ncbi:uncharacterized protein MEPE_00736 [Melanopsichium pennsylvanicum]|uniref:DH domain-containing protein n=2 Tax=Melanopsichium pennsylvanicum TaxID=63383 RepID=A0AAJ4XHW2_9BASI|nr:conserved hypothetical protein [Melanopsichium pennsylvanicum 4]SNX82031.1 uncharacterized protein MEPE_00736 [Melanopsichium pennsylvanicum]